jgi:agmatine deiminase
MTTRDMAGAALLVLMAGGAMAQELPIERYYRSGIDPLPRYMTTQEKAEAERLRPFWPGGQEAPSAPPTGPLRTVAEYEPMDGIICGWMAFNPELAQLAKVVTTTGNANFYVVLNLASQQASATTTLTNAGANMSRVVFWVAPQGLNSVWLRDYGPRYAYEGDCRVLVDHRYNRNRPKDDVSPKDFAAWRKQAYYYMGSNNPLGDFNHGGGNYHLDGNHNGYATRLIVNENKAPVSGQPWVTWVYPEPQIVDIWKTFWNINTTLYDPFPLAIDATQHIDMWMQVTGDTTCIISDWPNNAGSIQDQICDGAASLMAGKGYTVTRVPAFSVSAVHYTYTNMVMCNNAVIIPSYTNASVSPFNASTLATIQASLPAKTVVAQNGQNIVTLAGVFHCIVQHLPAHKGAPGGGGGLNPTAYLSSLNGGEVLTPGAIESITWISDDDTNAARTVDLLLSTDGGATYPTTIASGQPDSGSYAWTVPGLSTTTARVRVVVKDAQGNTGADSSNGDFSIASACYADCDLSGTLSIDDFICFQTLFAIGDPSADCDATGTLNIDDFICFQTFFAIGC